MDIYKENVKKYNSELLRLNKVLKRSSYLRLVIFIISSIVLIYLFSHRLFIPFAIVLPFSIVFFAWAITRHNKLAYNQKHTSFLKKINESETLRDECNLEEFDTGGKFIDPNHPYTSDLDIFGQHSIFQLVNRTTTESGSILLSQWFSGPTSNHEIPERQEAIKEMSQNLEWRQDFQASGMHFENKKSDYYSLMNWVKEPKVFLKNKVKYRILAILLPLLFLVSAYFFYANLDSSNVIIYLFLVISILVINALIIRKLNSTAESITKTATKNLSTLKGYHTLINRIESQEFNSKKLKDLQSILIHGKYSAYHEIKKLTSLLEFSEQRPIKKVPINGNFMYPILNNFLLLDIYLIIGIEKWKSKNKEFLKSWAAVVSEFEVINSLAGFYYSNSVFTFPKISEKNNYVHFEDLGHPLLNADARVCNDFHSEGYGDVIMITGSNMAGKSTFLRSVGVNIVLALAGAPCCAKNGEVSNLQLYSSMRTQDNLQKGISSFFAELNRIENMLNLIQSNNNVFFLLDEMFKGTNSKDRHLGGFSFINQVSKLKTSGIIATHDIELAKLAGHKKLVTNYSFNSEIQNNKMIFRYDLDPRICNDFNASELMKQSGIDIISNFSEYSEGVL
jgi:DNA mismatch repair ATPase MutS